MPQSITPQLRDALLNELAQLQSALLIQLQESSSPDYAVLLQQLQRLTPSHWPEALRRWQTPELKKRVNRLELVQAALSQMDMGMYGLCSDCECRIERRLLLEDPARQRCAKCEHSFSEHQHSPQL